MKAFVFAILTVLKVVVIGYTGFNFFRHFRSDDRKSLKYLALFFAGTLGLTAIEFCSHFTSRSKASNGFRFHSIGFAG